LPDKFKLIGKQAVSGPGNAAISTWQHRGKTGCMPFYRLHHKPLLFAQEPVYLRM